jgi:uncharacterized protein (DUF488 family)
VIATIGVYGFNRDSFLATFREDEVNLVLDVRQRRGVRGSEYAWANARRLQDALAEAAIGYQHLPELAPTTELREAQYREDAAATPSRSSTRSIWRRSSGSSARAARRCSASSAMPLPATVR